MTSQADHPFNEPSADIIICSSDNVTFRLHTVILSLASDFFKDMFSLPQPGVPSTSEPGELPVLNVSESSDVLERLFRLCYPVDHPTLGTIHEVRSTLEAALKYQMAVAIKIAKRRLRSLASADPLSVYAVACCFDLEAEAAAAAKEVLKQKLQTRYVPELEDLSIGAYHRLLSYCERGGRVNDRFRFTFHTSGGGRNRQTPMSTPSLTEASLEPVAPNVLPETRTAPHPFDSTEAEVTLVASDGMEFHVFKHILRLSSPVLTSKVSDIHPPSPLRVPLSEPSRILSLLLQLCYPVPEPRLSDLHDISAALIAAEKYEMQRACHVLRAALTAKKDDVSEDPVLLYAAACRSGMRELATAAAKRALRSDILKTPASELDSIGVTGGCLHRLIDHRDRCRAAVGSLFVNFSIDWISSDVYLQLQDSVRCGYAGENPCWFEPYLLRLSGQPWPSAEFATNEDLLQTILETTRDPISSYPCSYCASVQGTFLLLKLSKCAAEAISVAEKKEPLKWLSPAQYSERAFTPATPSRSA
ncbi:hypothetical protein BD309DRAFT_990543 [Dichomitus squalens]|uniref:Uncharacterized protein n=1 Tax=Dichomitus squalens TaxID=114155 RepID=A0A4Q9NS24_9APHY|nr:hypothetical protein BD309DRAFT_990543 [Dichomitus squalens]TBU53693.1 hypothetical protein BD310DRAFT_134059 [Dichomitus squalens]